MAEGWVKVNRSLLDNWIWQKSPFTYGQAWVDLILLANWEDKKIPYKDKIVICKRGDVNLSLTFLAERWKWDRRTVKKFLKILESDGMVSLNCTTQRTTITIINYGFFQDVCTTECTTKSQHYVQQSPITKKEKNKKNIYAPNKFNQFQQNDYDFDEIERLIQ